MNEKELNELFIDPILNINRQAGISQTIYVMEECSELIKAITKRERHKGSDIEIIEEACDVIAATLILLRELGVEQNEIKSRALYKWNRSINRYEKDGEI